MTLDYKKLENAMMKKCITPKELSYLSGVSYKTLYNYQHGCTQNHSLKVIGMLSKALDVEPSEIIFNA